MNDLAMMHIEVEGARLVATAGGPPDAEAILLLHGFPFSHRMWDGQIARLAESWQVVAYDHRGLGASDVGDGQYTMELYVDDLIGVLDGLELERVVVCGMSMGGYVALRAVERHPGRFAGLILMDTRSEADDDAAKIGRASAIRTMKHEGMSAFADDFLPRLFAPESFEAAPEAVASIRTMIEATHPIGAAGAMLAMAARSDTSAGLARVEIPVLIIVGEHDELTPPDAAERMQRWLPRSTLEVICGAGHMANLERPDAVNAALERYLSDL